MDNERTYIHLDVDRVLKETAKALLVRLEKSNKEIWIPLSCIADSDDYREGDTDCVISVTEWFALNAGLATK